MSDLEFSEYENENGGKVRAHVVTEDTAGTTVREHLRGTRELRVGDVITEAYQPGEYEFAGSDFGDNYKPVQSGAPSADVDSESEEADEANKEAEFDPSEHTATEVREYLTRGDLTDKERARVTQAEQSGRNRSTAFPNNA